MLRCRIFGKRISYARRRSFTQLWAYLLVLRHLGWHKLNVRRRRLLIRANAARGRLPVFAERPDVLIERFHIALLHRSKIVPGHRWRRSNALQHPYESTLGHCRSIYPKIGRIGRTPRTAPADRATHQSLFRINLAFCFAVAFGMAIVTTADD